MRIDLTYITSQDDLDAFVDRARGSSVLAIDTEFLRDKTYYAKLCLLQLATDDEVVLVDPLEGVDVEGVAPLFLDEGTVKIFHAASQDLEIIYHEMGILPHPIFDTQLAAALLGSSQQIGYGSIVKTVLGVSLDKADSYTDWSRRPLSDSQLSYAADDVAYLPKLYHQMHEDLEEKGRLHWLDGDFEELCRPERYDCDPYERFRHLKRGNQLTRHQLAMAREAAAWREKQARSSDIPRKWVLSDEQIVEACKRNARTVDDLFMVRGLRDRLGTRNARKLTSLMAESYDLPEEEWPEIEQSGRNESNVDDKIDLMNALVRLRAKESDIAVQTLASHADLVAVARGHAEDTSVLTGWRREIVGAELLDLLAGRIALSIEDGSLKVTRVS